MLLLVSVMFIIWSNMESHVRLKLKLKNHKDLCILLYIKVWDIPMIFKREIKIKRKVTTFLSR